MNCEKVVEVSSLIIHVSLPWLITSARSISIPVFSVMIFESLGESNHFTRSRVSSPFTELPFFLFPSFPRPTRLVHLENTEKKKKMNTQVIHFSRCCKEQLFRFTGPIDVGRKRRWLSRCSDIYNLTAYRTRVSLGHSFDPPPPVGEIPFRSVPWVTQGSECYVAWISFFTL